MNTQRNDEKETPKRRVSRRDINGLGGISKELDRVYHEYRAEKITEVQARTLTYILRTKGLVERDRYLDDIEKRIIEIESKLNEKRNN
jgi:hypothetical protein